MNLRELHEALEIADKHIRSYEGHDALVQLKHELFRLRSLAHKGDVFVQFEDWVNDKLALHRVLRSLFQLPNSVWVCMIEQSGEAAEQWRGEGPSPSAALQDALARATARKVTKAWQVPVDNDD